MNNTTLNTKYLNEIYDGMRKVIGVEKTKNSATYTLENIYNNRKYEIDKKTMKKLHDGETTMSAVIHRHLERKIDRRIG